MCQIYHSMVVTKEEQQKISELKASFISAHGGVLSIGEYFELKQKVAEAVLMLKERSALQ